MKCFQLSVVLCCLYSASFAQGQPAFQVNDARIKSVQVYREGWNLSYPVISLKPGEKLELHFDLLDSSPETYYYTFIHCDKDWNRSDIFVNQYLEGFPENPVEENNPSFNTTISYYHYRLSFPNERAKLLLSGNYILSVYPFGEQERPVLNVRFMVTEDIALVSASARRAQMAVYRDVAQQIDFTVNIAGRNIIDPFRNIYSAILQNGRWDNAMTNLKPEFYNNTELKYNTLSDKNIFRAGNEYRYFDIRSIRYLSEYVRKIDYSGPGYNVLLSVSENREAKPYFYHQDFNGKYYLAIQEGRDHNTEADYLRVFFTLKSAYPLPGSEVFVNGALTGWIKGEENKMTYNPEKAEYEGSLLLKQGWYNFEYTVTGKQPGILPSYFEGDYYETENDYTILVYYRNPAERYDRLIGSTTINTLNKLSY